MRIKFASDDPKAPKEAIGEIVSRTGGTLAITEHLSNEGLTLHSITHVHTGFALKVKVDPRTAPLLCRIFWRELDKDQKRGFRSFDVDEVRQSVPRSALRIFGLYRSESPEN